MNIGSVNLSSFPTSIDKISNNQQSSPIPGMTKVGEKDSYISSIFVFAADMAIPTSNYNAQGMMTMDATSISPMNEISTSGAGSSAMDMLSQTFRANADSIEMVLEQLGLNMEDLLDDTNMKKFADAMNQGAANLGVPQIDDLSKAMEEAAKSVKAMSEGNASEDAFGGSGRGESLGTAGTGNVGGANSSSGTGSIGESNSSSGAGSVGGTGATSGTGGGSGSGSSEDKTTTKIVEIDGVLYLETTTTQNGVKTITRTKI